MPRVTSLHLAPPIHGLRCIVYVWFVPDARLPSGLALRWAAEAPGGGAWGGGELIYHEEVGAPQKTDLRDGIALSQSCHITLQRGFHPTLCRCGGHSQASLSRLRKGGAEAQW